ncbi:hypothetical protein MPSEU_000932400 [Mayamaea pseudoterrestris]|nr:hypothetical protein MPSEU_000932400 [Mayamaea pseudoterrestris]
MSSEEEQMDAAADETAAAEEEVTTAAPPAPEATYKEPEMSEEMKQQAEQDEEIRVAMEMAMAAAKNPHLSPAELRVLVGASNAQTKIVDDFQSKRLEEQRKKEEEAAQAWEDKKASALGWLQGGVAAAQAKAEEIRIAAEKKAEEIRDAQARQLYAEEIKADPQYQDLRRRIKLMQKTLKAHRLQGNRVETRHSFKRQRQEKSMMQILDKLKRTQKAFVASGYNIHEYAKAMMKASKKWKKKGTDEELALEAQLCRNMHQMLALEKQKSKVKKSTREMKKYLQRCKGWLSDKQALCEMNLMTLDATHSSMQALYEDTIANQDKLIAKLKASGEFDGINLEEVELANWNVLSDKKYDHLGPSATLSALRGLPINDSVRLTKKKEVILSDDSNGRSMNGNHPELFIEAKDDGSVHSDVSDPDGDGDDASLGGDGGDKDDDDSSHGEGVDTDDAPWNKSASKGVVSDDSFPDNAKKEAVDIIDEAPTSVPDSLIKHNGKDGESDTEQTSTDEPLPPTNKEILLEDEAI